MMYWIDDSRVLNLDLCSEIYISQLDNGRPATKIEKDDRWYVLAVICEEVFELRNFNGKDEARDYLSMLVKEMEHKK